MCDKTAISTFKIRNLGKNENFPKLVSIYTTREYTIYTT